MPYNILLLPLLGGFLFVTFWDRTRWHADRAEKERLLIYAALAGLGFLGIAYLVRSYVPIFPCVGLCSLGHCWTPCLGAWWDKNIGFPYSGVASVAFILGAVGWWPLNRVGDAWYSAWALAGQRGGKRREFVRVVDNYGGPLEQLLLRSMQEKKAVMLTLKGGKVYIGRLRVGFVPGQDTSIHFLPSRSGFRDDQQRLSLTTDYQDVYIKIKTGETETQATEIIGSFGIIIPVDEVVAASLYLPKIHAKYFPHKSDSPDPLDLYW